ncbi:MAG: hypothetical protein H8E35_02680 [Ardenticatenia bacterium]|nr:hypothetical protein [Ardenticatenia bacterium]
MARWVKPTLDTKLHIDFGWWDENSRDLRVYLHQHLCKACREVYTSHLGSETVDWIDPETAEVQTVDGLWHALRQHCSTQHDYILESTPLTTAVFRVFLANGNGPLTPVELGARLSRPPEMILRVLGRGRVYDGIKPLAPEKKGR